MKLHWQCSLIYTLMINPIGIFIFIISNLSVKWVNQVFLQKLSSFGVCTTTLWCIENLSGVHEPHRYGWGWGRTASKLHMTDSTVIGFYSKGSPKDLEMCYQTFRALSYAVKMKANYLCASVICDMQEALKCRYPGWTPLLWGQGRHWGCLLLLCKMYFFLVMNYWFWCVLSLVLYNKINFINLLFIFIAFIAYSVNFYELFGFNRYIRSLEFLISFFYHYWF